MNDLNNRTHLVVDDIDDSLEQFKEEQAWFQRSNYTIKKVNTDEETIRVMFDWSLRELANDESVSFLYRDKSNSDWFESEVKNSGGLNYYIEKTLPLIANYEMQVIAKSKTGKRTATLSRLNMKDLIDNRFEMNANFFESREGIYEVDVNVYNTYYDYDDFSFGDNEALKIKKAVAIFFVNGKEVETKDLLDNDEDYITETIEMYYTVDLTENEDFKDTMIEDVQLKVVVEDYLGLKYEHLSQY